MNFYLDKVCFYLYIYFFWTVVAFCLPSSVLNVSHIFDVHCGGLTHWHSPFFLNQLLLHFSLHSSCLECDCLNTKPCHFCPVPSVYLSVHSVPPDQQQGQCGHQPQRACPHSFSGTLSACLAACMSICLCLTVCLFILSVTSGLIMQLYWTPCLYQFLNGDCFFSMKLKNLKCL